MPTYLGVGNGGRLLNDDRRLLFLYERGKILHLFKLLRLDSRSAKRAVALVRHRIGWGPGRPRPVRRYACRRLRLLVNEYSTTIDEGKADTPLGCPPLHLQ